ncbi:MAG: hypothetical protein E7Z93_07455 [Cyanobacteria bacterium SIG32]|nr:hypothetical protein [Cyanobacteria bacterium SIG32]
MIDDNILLVTENENVAENVLSKLVLLRESDSIAVCDYKMALKTLQMPSVSIVIVHERENNEKTLKFIEAIKSTEYEIILLVDKYDQDLILTAYDHGVTDYYSVQSEPYEMLIRTVNCFKTRALKVKSSRDLALLKQLSVVDEETGFYKYKFSKELLAEFIKDPKVKNGMFIILTLDETSKTRFSADKLSKAIKKSVRCDDVVSIVKGGKFYMILPNVDKHGAFSVVNKIQNLVTEKLIIRAGVAKISEKTFERLEKEAYSALSEACQSNETVVFLEEKVKTLDNWLDTEEKNEKNFKLFKNAYNNKLEKVIAPVFFRLQKAYEEKLFNTKIEQYSDELQSVFYLKNSKQESRLKITYPGFAKIVIYIIHEGLDSPENKEIPLNLNEITPKTIAKIVEDFIKEFKSCIKD